jgi:hypothetical protein
MMNRPRLVRALRIAWSVAWGIACALLIVLWARSYTWTNSISHASANSEIGAWSDSGGVVFERFQNVGVAHWQFGNHLISNDEQARNHPSFGVDRSFAGSIAIYVPYWFLVLISAALAAIAWLPWRFSLRTLLIAMTLVAVGLGLIVWLRSTH